MDTVIYKIQSSSDFEISVVGKILKDGGVVAIPTETVYGLAANALDPQAVKKIFQAKGRPADNPLIVHIASFEELYPLVAEVPKNAKALANAYWPGPLTIILKKSSIIPDAVSGGLDTVAVRMPAHPIARKIIHAAGVPLAAPSANLSGSPSPTCAIHVVADMMGRIDAIVDSGESGVGVESTVISLAENPPRLLRPGGITPEQLMDVLGEIEIDSAVYSQLEQGKKAASPGMKYKHYSPKANIIILKGSFENYVKYIGENNKQGVAALCFDGESEQLPVLSVSYGRQEDSEQQAHKLFQALRELDEIGAKTVYARCPSAEGVGLAVYNRLLRAAAFEVIEL